MEKIVITGIGIIAPNIMTKEEYWRIVYERTESIGKNYTGIIDLDVNKLCGGKDTRRTDHFTNLGLAALVQTVEDAGLAAGEYNQERTGAIINTTYGSLQTVKNYLKPIIDKGLEQGSPMHFPNTVINAIIGKLSIDFRLKGISSVICGASPVSYAFQKLGEGKADIVFTGGVDTLDEMISSTYGRMGLLEKGLKLSEGAGFVALETLESAKKRSAKIYAEVVGFASATDEVLNTDITQIGSEAVKYTMKTALQKAGITPDEVAMVQSLANTDDVAKNEEAAIKGVFGSAFDINLIKRGKAVNGEAFSASEMFSLISAVLSMERNKESIKYSITNSLNIGGNITSIVLKRYEG